MHLLNIRGKHAYLQWEEKRRDKVLKYCIGVLTQKEFNTLKPNDQNNTGPLTDLQFNLILKALVKIPHLKDSQVISKNHCNNRPEVIC